MTTQPEENDDFDEIGITIRYLWVKERRDFEARNNRSSDWGNRYMPEWDGGQTRDGRRKQSIWPKIAKFCIDNSLDPQTLIKAIFHRCKLTPPMPNMACGQHALAAYAIYASPGSEDDLRQQAHIALESQQAAFDTGMHWLSTVYPADKPTLQRIALSDSKCALTLLFRYCIAVANGFDDIAKKYYPGALEQYVSDRNVYDYVWSDLLPQELQLQADKLKAPEIRRSKK